MGEQLQCAPPCSDSHVNDSHTHTPRFQEDIGSSCSWAGGWSFHMFCRRCFSSKSFVIRRQLVCNGFGIIAKYWWRSTFSFCSLLILCSFTNFPQLETTSALLLFMEQTSSVTETHLTSWEQWVSFLDKPTGKQQAVRRNEITLPTFPGVLWTNWVFLFSHACFAYRSQVTKHYNIVSCVCWTTWNQAQLWPPVFAFSLLWRETILMLSHAHLNLIQWKVLSFFSF